MSAFDHVSSSPPDPILGIMGAYHADPRLKKVNLSVGVYKTPDLKTPVMSIVKEAEKALIETEKTKEYLPIDGDKNYLESTGMLILGKPLWEQISEKVCKFQTLGGTGALRIGGDFLKQEIGNTIYISTPSWPNHKGVFTQCGFKVETYPYYNTKTNVLEFEAMYEALSRIPEGSIVVLHASCHNPSGIDLTKEQWTTLLNLFLARRLIAFFDAAYLGFDGGVEQDAEIIRLFVEKGVEILIAVSFSKNFSLYAERIGTLFILTSSPSVAQNVTSKVKTLIRRNYSNPSVHGARIIAEILTNPSLKKKWEIELSQMRERVFEMRKAFSSSLISKSKHKDYSYLAHTKGLFCFCSLEKSEVEKITKEYGIYMTSDGRINIAGLNWDNLDYVVDAIVSITR